MSRRIGKSVIKSLEASDEDGITIYALRIEQPRIFGQITSGLPCILGVFTFCAHIHGSPFHFTCRIPQAPNDSGPTKFTFGLGKTAGS